MAVDNESLKKPRMDVWQLRQEVMISAPQVSQNRPAGRYSIPSDATCPLRQTAATECRLSFKVAHLLIGRPLDTPASMSGKSLKTLALPRGIEPLFQP